MELTQLIVAMPLTVLGCVLAAAGVVLTWRSLSHTAAATVRAVEKSEEGEIVSQTALLQFTTRGGQLVELRVPAAADQYAAGEQVTVLYDPDYPQIAQVASPVRLWVVPAALALVGLIIGLVGFTQLSAAVR